MNRLLGGVLICWILWFTAIPSAVQADQRTSGILRYYIKENFSKGVLEKGFVFESSQGEVSPLVVSGNLSSMILRESRRYLGVPVDVAIETRVAPLSGRSEQELLAISPLAGALDVSVNAVTGTKKLGVFLFTLADGGVTIPDENEVMDVLVNDTYNVKSALEENSRGTLTLGAIEVYGPFALARSKNSCDFETWKSDVDAILTGLSVDISAYDHTLYVAPNEASCSWAGLAEVTGSNSWYTEFGAKVVIHELGHNFGFGHASTNPNNSGSISEYGDSSCVQGLGYRWFNPVHLARTEWLAARGATIREISGVANETISLYPAEYDPAGAGGLPQLIKVTRAGVDSPYYLAFRKNSAPANAMIDLGINDNRRVHVVRWEGGSENTFLVTRLAAGGSFSASDHNCAFNFLSEGADSASVQVQCTDVDSDGDGLLNEVDPDDDNDGVADVDDCSPLSASAWRNTAFDDSDIDGVRTSDTLQEIESCFGTDVPFSYTLSQSGIDNCPFTYNPLQSDADEDGVGDACDDAFDGDPTEIARPTVTLQVPMRLVTQDEVATVSGLATHDLGAPTVQYRIIGVRGGWTTASYESGSNQIHWSFGIALNPGKRSRYRVRAMYLNKKASIRGIVRRRRQ